MTDLHKKQLRLIGMVMVGGVILILGGWVVASSMFEMGVLKTCRFAGITVMLLLFTCFLLPLLLNQPHEQRIRGWVIFWFVGSLGFDLLWEREY